MTRFTPTVLLIVAVLVPPARAERPPVDPAWTVDDGTPREVEPAGGDEADAGRGDEAAAEGEDDGFRYALHGYYRARAHVLGNVMYPLNPADQRTQTLRYMTQRLRLEPEVGYGEWITLHVTLDLLDDVLWGDNAGLSTTPLFAGDPSRTRTSGEEAPWVYVRHAWIESNLPLGVLRVGRQPSDWGLGLLSDDGDGFDDDFGDNHYGSTCDRLLFATKPISIARAIAGLPSADTPLILVVAWEKLVEDFLEQDEIRPPYDSGWLAGDDDDVDEWFLGLVWKQDGLDWFAETDALTAGYHFVYREQPSTSSQVFIHDAFARLRLWDLFFEGELYAIHGSTYAIPLGPEDPVTHLYPYKEADLLGWIARLGWSRWMFTAKAEAGYASGDADPADGNFSGRAAAPDVNVGLILYEELLAERTRNAWVENEGMWSKGGVYNSWFLSFVGIVEPWPGLQLTLGVLTAWADEVCDPVYQGMECEFQDPDGHPNLGVELDASVRYRFFRDHVLAVLEAGWLRPDAGAFNLGAARLEGTDLWTLQSRIAFTY